MLIPETTQVTKNRTGRLSVVLGVCILALLVTGMALAQAKKPISKNGLLESISLNALTTKELVAQVQARGVNFQMSPADEQEFRTAGARAELIDAIKANYKGGAAPVGNTTTNNGGNNNSGNSSGAPLKPRADVPPGPPLAKSEVVTMLQGGLPSERVQQFVEARGVTFSVNPAITREINAAGGNQALVAAISSRGPANSGGNDSGKEIFKGGMLGVHVTEVTGQLATEFGLPDLGGAFVDAVEKGTTADRAGIKRGDVIVEFNGEVVNANTLPILVSKAPAQSTYHFSALIFQNSLAANHVGLLQFARSRACLVHESTGHVLESRMTPL